MYVRFSSYKDSLRFSLAAKQRSLYIYLLDVKESKLLAKDAELHEKAVGLCYSRKEWIWSQEWEGHS